MNIEIESEAQARGCGRALVWLVLILVSGAIAGFFIASLFTQESAGRRGHGELVAGRCIVSLKIGKQVYSQACMWRAAANSSWQPRTDPAGRLICDDTIYTALEWDGVTCED